MPFLYHFTQTFEENTSVFLVFSKAKHSTLFLRKTFFFIFFLSVVSIGFAQNNDFATSSHLGTTGLIFTPSAYLSQWGMVDIGYTHYSPATSFTYEAGLSPERSFFINTAYLPFAEVSFKVTKPYVTPVDSIYGIGDRSVSLRFQVLKETKNWPAVVVGTQDPFTVRAFFNTNYVVLTKKYPIKKLTVVPNLGYGFALSETEGDYLRGVFAGVQTSWKNWQLSAEYDTHTINTGLSYSLKNWLFLKAALINQQYFSGSIHFRFSIE